MNLLTLAFLFVSYGLFAAMYNGGDSAQNIFPTFNAPNAPDYHVGSCNWWVFCTNVLADWVGLIAQTFVYAGSLLIEIIRMFIAVITLIVTNAFTGFDGAPTWFNGLVLVGLGGSIAIGIYKAIRKGDTDST